MQTTSDKQDRIRVLHIIDKLSIDRANPTSCAQLLAHWAAAHDADRFEVRVCNLQEDPGGPYLEQLGITVHSLRLGKISPRIARELVQLIRRWEVDIVHLHGYSAANFGRIAARLVGIPSIVHEHAVLRILPHQFIADLTLRPLNDTAIAISDAVKQFMIRGRSIPADRIRVIHNGIELERFTGITDEQIAAFRAAWGIADDRRVVGTLTRLFEIKGNRFFVDAAARVAARYPDVVFLVVGEGPEREALVAQARRLGLGEERLVFAGYVSDVATALAAMDIAVVSSLQEGLSLVVLEAMAAGRPIVATEVGGIPEILTHGETGLLVPPSDEAALAAAIDGLLADGDRAATLAQAALRESERHGLADNVRALEELYEALTGTG